MLFEDFYLVNFNPRSREGSDIYRGELMAHDMISIHAPARGATVRRITAGKYDGDFNPRSREGSDKKHWNFR